ncbi:MAG: AI-2E family transporter [Lachnospiraceae bacterium]|nr:AI-2E family transporter [Lachnospiraceae bacterium]
MKEKWRNYYHIGLAAFFTIAMCITFFFIMFRFDEVRSGLKMVAGILRPFIYGAVIAYLLIPICKWFEQQFADAAELDKKPEQKAAKYRKVFSALSIFLSLFLFCLVIYALIAMVVPQLISSVLILVEALPGYVETVTSWIEKLVEDNPVMINYVEQYSEDMMQTAQHFAKNSLVPNINNIITGVSASLWTVVLALKDLIIGLIVAVYLMGSRTTFSRQAKQIVHAIFPEQKNLESDKEQRADWILRETYILNNYLGGFVKGKLLDSLIIGLICMVFTVIVEMPYAVLVSVVIGVTNIIPFFGPFIGAIPTSILILIVDPVKCVYFVIFILVLQQFDGNILGPKILGETTNLNSFWVLFAILLFGGLFGVPGMVLGVPIFAFVYQLIREWVHKRLKLSEKEHKMEEEKN